MPYKNPEEKRANRAKRYAKRNILKFSLAQELGGRCLRCGEDNPLLLDFHHKDSSTKEVSISRMLTYDTKYEETKKEAQKCVLLCANCHRKEHHEHSWLMSFPGSNLYICPWEYSFNRKEKTKAQKEREMEKFIDTQLKSLPPYLT
jgi:hypothetical protein